MSSYVSALDLFSIGIGPSSSHTVGPMRAARAFVDELAARDVLHDVAQLEVVLCGSLGATGIGHGTPDAVVAGLRGLDPETCDPDDVPGGWEKLGDGATVTLRPTRSEPAPAPTGRTAESPGESTTTSTTETPPGATTGADVTVATSDVRLAPLTRLPGHPNGMRFTAADAAGSALVERVYYSVGGGFVLTEHELAAAEAAEAAQLAAEHGELDPAVPDSTRPADVPHPFATAAELLATCARTGLSIAEVAWANECALRPEDEVGAALDAVWATMSDCVDGGLERQGTLPGRLRVRRRARAQRERLEALDAAGGETTIEWLQAYAMAVNEENADGRRVVTAPTNGAAGIIPAVGRHYLRITPGVQGPEAAARRRTAMRTYLLTAAAIGALYKRNASISGAEAGCQGEVGSACSMAAGAMCALLGGTPEQVENAAEIAMEHNLGLTCDPVGGLVQVPCIERNAIAACTAVSAARMAMQGDGLHVVSLDTVIETMRQTGLDMSTKYKETSEGGLAVNVIEC
ncbi:L-serine dehydratase [Sediminihabitans luteus]|uniref:L-serine ammonia-lyase n=1 Tax=Sediminihabitans luteus TaxID=1138585 RepID=A0A2M9CD33_9CELL|nr:L-serine ammonia-lyase [Sediminihabitans luteus]PJJ69259.1 L-serine dehydratase [Sediminihabitans luteus]GII98935.1 L-serine dehydratase [Sediminihabitans luteus]